VAQRSTAVELVFSQVTAVTTEPDKLQVCVAPTSAMTLDLLHVDPTLADLPHAVDGRSGVKAASDHCARSWVVGCVKQGAGFCG
jgi:hypothetical protein